MDLFRHTSFSENPYPQECRFKEKGEQSFNGKRSTENVAHITGILRPVHTKLKFLNDACDYANGKINEKQFSPKFCHLTIIFIFCLVIARLYVGDKPSQPQRKRNKKKMGNCRQPKLPS